MRKVLALACLASLLAGPTAMADTLLVDKASQAQSDRPTRGMLMDAVARQYGEPQSRLPAVGDPPITRWVYDSYVVYFERDRVLHAVTRQ